MSTSIIEQAYAAGATPSGNFIKIAGGVDPSGLARALQLSSGLNLNIKANTGIENGSYPQPTGTIPSGSEGSLSQDAFGNLETRGPVLTDEESLRNDFEGSSLNTSIGTITLTNGSTAVTGTGFITNGFLSGQYYIKATADAVSAWAQIASVNSDTSITLSVAYAGTGGTNVAGTSTQFPVNIVGSATATVSTSIVSLASATTNGNQAQMYHDFDYLPMLLKTRFSVSQRIANQTINVGFVSDTTTTPAMMAQFVFLGSDSNTTVRTRTSYANATIEETVVTLPFSLTSATANDYEVDLSLKKCVFLIQGVIVATHVLHLPDPYMNLTAVWNILNTGTAGSTTTLAVDNCLLSNQDQVEVSNSFSGQALPVLFNEEVHSIYGLLTTTATTADQVVATYTVPTNRSLWILSYSLSTSSSTISASPLRIAKNTWSENSSGTTVTDGNILDSYQLNVSSSGTNAYNRVWTTPIRFCASGDVLKVTVTPSGTSSATWRASVQFVLR